jgi:uncharacterized membrane protein YgcG
MRGSALYCVSAMLLSACASTELNYNTLDLGSTTNDLLTRQIGYNLSNFIDSELAFPAQIIINSGTATTADSLQPTVTAPFSKQFTNTAAVAMSGNNPGTTLTNAAQLGAFGLSLQAQDTRTQNWAYATITNARQAARLSALYRFAVDGDKKKLKENYPLLQKSVGITKPECLRDKNKYSEAVFASGTTTDPKTGLPRYFSSCLTGYSPQGSGITLSEGSDTFSILVPDEYYLKQPNCVLCGGNRTVNARLRNDHLGNWLHWKGSLGAAKADTYMPGDIFLGRYGKYELFVDHRQPEKFAQFSLFVLAASTDADATVTSGGSGGGGGGSAGGGGSSGKGAAPAAQILIAPGLVQ